MNAPSLLDALVRVAIEESERAIAQALRGERDVHTGALWETCFRRSFEQILNEWRIQGNECQHHDTSWHACGKKLATYIWKPLFCRQQCGHEGDCK